MNKRMHAFIWLNFGLIFTTIIVVGIIRIYPFEVARFTLPYKVHTPVVKQGESMRYQRNREKYIDVPGIIGCEFQDGLTFTIPMKASITKTGLNTDNMEILVPKSLPEGTYRYYCKVTWDMWGISTVSQEFYTEDFTVIK